jgi:hypothetical protein
MNANTAPDAPDTSDQLRALLRVQDQAQADGYAAGWRQGQKAGYSRGRVAGALAGGGGKLIGVLGTWAVLRGLGVCP